MRPKQASTAWDDWRQQLRDTLASEPAAALPEQACGVAKRKAYSRRAIADILQQHAQGVPITALCARFGISRSTLYRWRKQPSEKGAGKQSLEDENRSLKRRVGELTVEKTLLQQFLRRAR